MNSDFPIIADNKKPLSAACQSKTNITILKNDDNKRLLLFYFFVVDKFFLM